MQVIENKKSRYSNLKGTIDKLIEVLGEPRRIQYDLDRTRLEWNYQTIDGNLVTIYGFQQGSSTSISMSFFEEGCDRLNTKSYNEINELLQRVHNKKMRTDPLYAENYCF